jgi:anti-sigma B factor antagonist
MGATEQLQIETHREEDRVILRLEGELDMATAPQLRSAIEELGADEKPMLVLDLQQLSFIDSTGLRLVLWANERYRKDGREFAMTPGSPQVRRLLSISGAGEHLRIIATSGELV